MKGGCDEERGTAVAEGGAALAFWDAARSGLPVRKAGVAAVLAGGGGVVPAGRRGEGERARPGKRRYLSLAKRQEIAVGVAAGGPPRLIASWPGRRPATADREIRP